MRMIVYVTKKDLIWNTVKQSHGFWENGPCLLVTIVTHVCLLNVEAINVRES